MQAGPTASAASSAEFRFTIQQVDSPLGCRPKRGGRERREEAYMATREMVAGSEQTRNALVSSSSASYIRPLAILTTLFFLWGFLTSLNDILVPHLKSISDFSYTKVMLVQFAFFSAYFLFSVPWSMVVNKIGYQKTMVAGLVSMSVGALLFVPAASIPSFPLLLAGLMILAAGIT